MVPGDVPLQRDTPNDPGLEPRRPGNDAVRPVGSDDHARAHRLAAHRRLDAVRADLDLRDPGVVAKARTRSDRLLDEIRIEPPPLRHQDQRFGARSAKAVTVVETKLERVDDALDDRPDVARRLPERPPGDTAAARLVAREARSIGEQDARAAAGEMDRGRGSGRPGTDDEDVVALHGISLPDTGPTRDSVGRSSPWERPSPGSPGRS